MKGISWEEFLKKAVEVHGDKFDYSQAEYINMTTKIKIICKTCGYVFYRTPSVHLRTTPKREGSCRRCSYKQRGINQNKPFDVVKKEMEEVHNGKYSYDEAEKYYKKAQTKIPIRCPIHGIFWQSPNIHKRGVGCPKCGRIALVEKQMITFEEFKRRSIEAHGDLYDYSLAEQHYVDTRTEIPIICPVHGVFYQMPQNHFRGIGCWRCGVEKRAQSQQITFDEFMKRAQQVHGVGRYTYFRETYINSRTETQIKCSKCGKTFWQLPYCHVGMGNGCPLCRESRMEKAVENLLVSLDVSYVREKRFAWLRYKSSLRLDFYLPDYKMVIECQGAQHFVPVDFGGRGLEYSEKQLIEIQSRDKAKKEKCEEHGLIMLYYNHFDDFPEFSMRLINEIRKTEAETD